MRSFIYGVLKSGTTVFFLSFKFRSFQESIYIFSCSFGPSFDLEYTKKSIPRVLETVVSTVFKHVYLKTTVFEGFLLIRSASYVELFTRLRKL